MANENLTKAKNAKNDEFYTQYHDIEKEVNAHLDYNHNVFRGKTVLLPCDDPESSNFTKYFVESFERLGLKKLISTSYAYESKLYKGRLYETYHTTPYSPAEVSVKVRTLYADSYVKNRRGIFEFILGGSVDYKLLDVRVFDEATKKAVYAKQTATAIEKGISNCPLCVIGHDANKTRIYKITEMDADHVTAWSKGGTTDINNCEMLCKTHNRAKGNR